MIKQLTSCDIAPAIRLYHHHLNRQTLLNFRIGFEKLLSVIAFDVHQCYEYIAEYSFYRWKVRR